MWIFTFIVAIYAMFLLSGCSAKFHYNKAVAKGMRCETSSDTITIDKIRLNSVNYNRIYFFNSNSVACGFTSHAF